VTAIGLLNEKSLHSALKHWYARPGDRLESPLDGYVVDILRGDHVIEIQTRNFARLLTSSARHQWTDQTSDAAASLRCC
jgi:hypothetical protein